MLKKLIKYDLIWVNKFMLIFFSISLIISTLTRIMSNFNTSFIGNIIYLILRGTTISCVVTIIINCIIRLWVRFKLTLYKDESYLTHTLPISKNTLYNSKVLSSIISIIISILVIILCLITAFLNKEIIELLKVIFNDKDNIYLIISLIFTAILEIIYLFNSGLIGLIIGERSNNYKTIKAVFIGIVLYFTLQTILLSIIYSIGLINTNMNDLFINNSNIDIKAVKQLIFISDIIYLLFNTTMYYIGKTIINKGVNVE